jgi:release factor glutamine methyltransferase
MQQAFTESAQILREAGIETAELDARVLLCHAAGLSHETYIARAREALPADAALRLAHAIARRLAREPVARITGVREFYGRSFILDKDTLDPRPDTETLIEAALDIVRERDWQEKPLSLLDLGTGSGCILVTLLAELPHARGLGTDLSEGALAIAAANAEAHGVGPRASFAAADWLDGISGKFDLVLSNPPYISTGTIAGLAEEVAAHDPRLALDGGPDGLDAYRRIAMRARDILTEDGHLLVEIGAGQGEDVAAIFACAGLLSGARGDATLPAGPASSSQGFDPGLHAGAWRQKRTWKSGDNRVRFVTENDYWAISRRAGGAWTGCKGNTSVFS